MELQIPKEKLEDIPEKIVLTSSRRKSAVARVTMTPGNGVIRINGRRPTAIQAQWRKETIKEPLVLLKPLREKVNIDVNVSGGGNMGQAQAIRTAIARAFVNFFDDIPLERFFRKYDRYFLIQDPRRKEMRKWGGPGARARKQKSYR